MGEPTLNQKLAEIAQMVDKNIKTGASTDNDGKILNSAKEIELFEQQGQLFGINAKDIELFKTEVAKSDETVAQLMGGDFSSDKKSKTKAKDQVVTGTKVPMTRAQKDELEDRVAKAVLRLAYQGKDFDGIMNGLYHDGTFVQTETNEEGETVFVTEMVDGKKRPVLKPQYEEIFRDIEKIYDVVEKSGADHQYSLFGFNVKRKYTFASKWYNKAHYEAKKEIMSELSDTQKSFIKKIQRGMEDAAQTSRVDAKFTPLKEAFDKLAGSVEDNLKNKTIPEYEGILDGMKARLKETKEYKDADTKAAFKKLKQYAKQHARELCSKLMHPQTGDVYQKLVDGREENQKITKKDFRRELRALSEDGIFRDAIQDLKTDRKILARTATVASKLEDGEFSDMSYEDVVNELDKRLNLGLFKINVGGGKKLTGKLDDTYGKNGDDKNDPYNLEKSDNTYDFDQLVKDVVSRVGFDYMLSRNDDDIQMAEVENVRQVLQRKCPGKTFSDNEVKRICKLCCIAIEHRSRSLGDFLKNLALGLPLGLGAFANAVITGMNAATKAIGNQGSNLLLSLQVSDTTYDLLENEVISQIANDPDAFQAHFAEMTRDQQLDWIKEAFGIDIKALAEAGQKMQQYTAQDVLSGKFQSDMQLLIMYNEYDNTTENAKRGAQYADNALHNIIFSVAIAALPALVSLAFGENKNEKSCISVSDYAITESLYTDIDKYKEYVDRRFGHNPQKAEAMKSLADACARISESSGYEWHEIFNDLVREAAGYGSKLNPEECRAFQYYGVDITKYKNKAPEQPAPQQQVQQPNPTVEPVVQPVEPAPQQPVQAKHAYWAEEDDLYIEKANKYTWKELIKVYDCFPQNDINKSIRMFKVMQGMDETALTIEQITTLAELSQKAHLRYKNVRGHRVPDKADYERQIRQLFSGVDFLQNYNFKYEQFVNAVAEPVPGDKNNRLIAPKVLYYNNETTCERNKDPKYVKADGGGRAGDRGVAGRTTNYYAKVNGDKVQRQNTQQNWDFRQSHPEAEHVTVEEIYRK